MKQQEFLEIRNLLFTMKEKSIFDKIPEFIKVQKYITRGIYIGNNTYINPNSLIIIKNKLEIGVNCKISWGLTIMDDDLH